MRLHERGEVLARLQRRHGEDVVAAEVCLRTVAGKDLLDSRQRDPHALLGNLEQLDDVARREGRVREDEVARPRHVPVLRRVHAARPPLYPLRMAQRHQVVDRRGADPGALRRIHPVGEVEHVDRAEKALDSRPPQAAPPLAPEVREGRNCSETSTGTPSSAAGMAFIPRGLVGAKATISCSPPATSAKPASEPRRYVPIPDRGCESGETSKAILTARSRSG